MDATTYIIIAALILVVMCTGIVFAIVQIFKLSGHVLRINQDISGTLELHGQHLDELEEFKHFCMTHQAIPMDSAAHRPRRKKHIAWDIPVIKDRKVI